MSSFHYSAFASGAASSAGASSTAGAASTTGASSTTGAASTTGVTTGAVSGTKPKASSTAFSSAGVAIILSRLADFGPSSLTSAAVKASDFYAEYKNSLVNGVAPIPGQELAIRMAYSFLLDKPMFQLFGKAYNDKLLSELEGADFNKYWTLYGKAVSPEGKLNNSYGLQFLNTFLVEGIPGAGKTSGF